jgi:hypothetical protein
MKKHSPKKLIKRTRIIDKRAARLRKIAQAYFNGLSKRNLSSIPYDGNVILRAPLAPGGAVIPIEGKAAVLDYLNGILHILGEVKVLEHYFNEQRTKICTEAEIEVISPKSTLHMADCFTVSKAGKIIAHTNYYDPRPALPPSR